MKYDFKLSFLNTVVVVKSIQGDILKTSKKVNDSFYNMTSLGDNIYFDKIQNSYWKKNINLVKKGKKKYFQEEYIEVTQFLQENLKLSNDLKKDPLTQIGNVAAITAKEKEIVLTGKSCVMVMCDVNDFKTINDTFGHAIGDKALQGIARVFENNRRNEHDCITRIGGDEFFLIFETSNVTSILEKMDIIQNEIKILGDELNIPLSISVGISYFAGSEQIYINNQNKLSQKKQEADQALYYVKKNTTDKNNIAYFNSDTEEIELYHEEKQKCKILNY